MPDILLVHASTHGHTAKIAARIADVLREDGMTVAEREISAAGDADPGGFDAVILGASIHAGHHQSAAIAWATEHAAELTTRLSAFFSVCLTAAEDTDEANVATRGYLDDFAVKTGWTPTATRSFAGALQYREYDFMTRLLMRMMMRRGGHPTDTSQDYDYTDWDAVESFAHDVARSVMPTAPPAQPAR